MATKPERSCGRCGKPEHVVRLLVTLFDGEIVCFRCLGTDPSGHPSRGPRATEVDLDDDATPIEEAA